MQYSIINYSHHAVHYTPMTYHFITRSLYLSTSSPICLTPHVPPLATTNLFSVWDKCLRLAVLVSILRINEITRYLSLSVSIFPGVKPQDEDNWQPTSLNPHVKWRYNTNLNSSWKKVGLAESSCSPFYFFIAPCSYRPHIVLPWYFYSLSSQETGRWRSGALVHPLQTRLCGVSECYLW